MPALTTVREVVKALGGGAVVGDLTGTSRFAVHNWVKRNQFPGHHYKAIQEMVQRLHGAQVADDLFARVLVHPRALKDVDQSPAT